MTNSNDKQVDDGTGKLTHTDVANHLDQELDWPQYFASGEDVDAEDFVPAYYRVEGPNGPVLYMNPNSGPYVTTMYEFAMEASGDNFQWCEKEETPWVNVDEEEIEAFSD